MASAKQRGSKVVYVAGAAREFPQDVQDWLSHTAYRPAACPHVYDALAQLVSGRRPAALIVSLEAIDWDELEFFDLVPRLSRDTRVFVAGLEHQQAKLEAALARGAEPFEPAVLDELLQPLNTAPQSGTAGLLAASLRPEMPPAPQIMPKVVPPEPPEVQPEQPDQEESEEVSEEEPPPVRLVTSTEFEESEAPVPFPWAPAANRPQRTPPQAPPSSPSTGEPPMVPRSKPAQPVMLTAEELAELLGRKLPGKEGQAQEGRG